MNEQQREKVHQSWDKFLDPESLRSNLIACSLFIVAWETFSNAAINHLRGFYSLGIDPELNDHSPEYESEVLNRDKSQLSASLLWFQERGAIDQEDLDAVDRCRIHRNDIAHELPKYLSTVEHTVDIGLFSKLIELTGKIGRWWVLEIEVPTNSDFDNQEVRAEDVQSGDMWFLGMLLHIATGDAEEAGAFHKQFIEMLKANAPLNVTESDKEHFAHRSP